MRRHVTSGEADSIGAKTKGHQQTNGVVGWLWSSLCDGNDVLIQIRSPGTLDKDYNCIGHCLLIVTNDRCSLQSKKGSNAKTYTNHNLSSLMVGLLNHRNRNITPKSSRILSDKISLQRDCSPALRMHW
jgi:hypothetical protein